MTNLRTRDTIDSIMEGRCFRLIIGVPKEIKNNESRVGLTPGGVHAFVTTGHTAKVESGAGSGSYLECMDYVEVEAELVGSGGAAWDGEMIVKVKEALMGECGFVREGIIVYTFLPRAP